MRRMQTWRWLPAALLLAAGGTTGRAEEFAIQSFDGTGQIVFGAVAGATNYQALTAPAPTGTWSAAGAGIAPTSANAITTTVSVAGAAGFYRIVAFTNTAAQPEGLYLVVDLSGGTNAPNYPVTYLSAVPPGGWADEHKTTKLVLRRIPATTPDFTMGSPRGELGRDSDETQHQVTLTKDFYLGVFEVTQRQWELVMGSRRSYFNNATYYQTRPMESVSYYEIRENPASSDDPAVNWPANSAVNANSFMGKLRAKTGLTGFDLPTESQWEYACRAGTATALNSGYNLTSDGHVPYVYWDAHMDQVGRYWYNGGSGYSQGCTPSAGTATVGSYLANQWGLYDMHGNVWEWCLDWYGTYPGTVTDPAGAASGLSRVLRGGSWNTYAGYCRSAERGRGWPVYWFERLGFRLARTLP